jgi:O-antigen/teichoic acid export membrane protein
MCLKNIGDAGLTASFIRQPTPPTRQQEVAIFTAQQILVGVPFLLAAMFSNLFNHWWKVDAQICSMLQVAFLTGFISLYRNLPHMLLERNLCFGVLAKIEFAEALSYQICAVAFAFMGKGAWSFIWAGLISQSIGTILCNLAQPWRIAFGWKISWPELKERLSYGFAFQGTMLIQSFKESINPMFVGFLLGTTAVGFIGFATTLASYPLGLTLVFGRIYFRLFSTVQLDKEKLQETFSTVMRWNNVWLFGLTSLLIPLAKLAMFSAFGVKWLPALPIVYFLAASNLMLGVSIPVVCLFNALGRADRVFKFVSFLILVNWIICVPLIYAFGIVGYGIGTASSHVLYFLFFRQSKQLCSFSMLRTSAPTIAAAIVNSLLLLLLSDLPYAKTAVGLCVIAAFGLVSYMCLSNLFWGGRLFRDFLTVCNQNRAKAVE